MPELVPAEPGTPAWHAVRRQGVTATDIVTIPCCLHCVHGPGYVHQEPCPRPEQHYMLSRVRHA